MVVEVAADDVGRSTINQIPGVDVVMLAQVEVVQGCSLFIGDPGASGPEVHHAHRAYSVEVIVRGEEQAHLVERHLDHRLGQPKTSRMAGTSSGAAVSWVSAAPKSAAVGAIREPMAFTIGTIRRR